MTMRPCRGVDPALRLRSVVLPDPDGPMRARTRLADLEIDILQHRICSESLR